MSDLIDSVLLSESGQRMMSTITDIYNNSLVMCWLYEGIGREYDSAWSLIEDLKAQTKPETATWSLPYWEQRYGILTSSGTADDRRQAVISKRSLSKQLNPARFAEILKGISGRDCLISEPGDEPFIFDVIFLAANNIPINSKRVKATINRLKQAHMSYVMYLQAETTVNIAADGSGYIIDYPICGTIVCQ